MKNLDNYDREWAILRKGPICLYRSLEILREDISWFTKNGYCDFSFDSRQWTSKKELFRQMESTLSLPQLARNFDAFEDDLCEIPLPNGIIGFVLTLYGFDKYTAEFPQDSNYLLDIFAIVSRLYLIDGIKMIVMLHIGDTRLKPQALGCIYPDYNPREA